jgi:heme exporter protein C
MGGSAIDPAMLGPLLIMAGGFACAAGALTLMGMRALIHRRQALASELRLAQSAARGAS